MADRLVVLNAGWIEQVGEIYHRPATTFVASFIGPPAMHLPDAEVDGSRLRVGNHVIDAVRALPGQGAITFGIRLKICSLDDGPEPEIVWIGARRCPIAGKARNGQKARALFATEGRRVQSAKDMIRFGRHNAAFAMPRARSRLILDLG